MLLMMYYIKCLLLLRNIIKFHAHLTQQNVVENELSMEIKIEKNNENKERKQKRLFLNYLEIVDSFSSGLPQTPFA